MTALMPLLRSSSRLALDVYALSARTSSGRVRGAPPPMRGTQMPSRSGPNIGLSPAWPGPTSTDKGRPSPSHARWTLQVSPPRDRPMP